MVYQGSRLETALPPAVAGPAFLRDGTEVWVRPVQPSDRDMVLDLLEREASGSLELGRLAMLRPPTATGREASSFAERLCLLVLGASVDRVLVLGVGEYARPRSGGTVADVTVVVGGPYRDRGIATLLLARLARAARAFGVLSFRARLQGGNTGTLELFRESGLPSTERCGPRGSALLIPLGAEFGPGGSPPAPRSAAHRQRALRGGGQGGTVQDAPGRHRVPAVDSVP